MSKVEIRKAEPGDEKILAYIQTESWKSAFDKILSPEEMTECANPDKAEIMYRNVLKDGQVNIRIELVDSNPHCIAGWSTDRGGAGADVAELICIHSLPNNLHKGYGSIMMEHILAEIKENNYSEVILWVFEENMVARKFYEKHGFTLTPRKELSHGATEVMYSKKLQN